MLFTKIKNNLKDILINKPTVILGLSGGPDSVFLFHFLKELHDTNQINLIAAHLDHGWRQESKQDVLFCQNLCKEYKVDLVCHHAQDLSLDLKFNGSKEELGRKLRRFFFQKLLKEKNADYIALAHHLQDQQETFFWRIIRGTTLSGLTCMKPLDNSYLRPLLNISKEEILDYLHKNKIPYLTDHTNESDEFLRNRIRKYVLPALNKCDSRFDQKFESSLKHLQKEEAFIQNYTQKAFDSVFTKSNAFCFIGNLNSFLNLDLVLQKRLLILWLSKEKVLFSPSNSYLNEILKFLKSKNGGSHQLGIDWKLCKKKNLFWI